jgi:hypothetical protein
MLDAGCSHQVLHLWHDVFASPVLGCVLNVAHALAMQAVCSQFSVLEVRLAFHAGGATGCSLWHIPVCCSHLIFPNQQAMSHRGAAGGGYCP